jgi:uncharacterized damage-inducible protein DinB
MRQFLVLLVFLGCVVSFAQEAPTASKSVSDSIRLVWENAAHGFTAVAEAMPEDKWSFKPTQGKFDNVRTFGEQVKHVACGTEAWAKKIQGEKKLPERCDLGGANPAKSKAEILAYLRESIRMMDDAIASTHTDNLQQPLAGPYLGDTRLACMNAALWHLSDHYGQLVVYLRMNGLVPPGSR